MENSTSTHTAETPTTGRMKETWIRALHRRLCLIYMAKFTSSFPDAETVDDWCDVWAERLAGISAEQIKYGLDRTTKECQWPPTLVEFRQFCEAAPRPALPKLPAPSRLKTDFGARHSRRILDMVSARRAPGNWWAHEVLAKVQRNEPVTAAAFELAKLAIARGAPREPGADDGVAA